MKTRRRSFSLRKTLILGLVIMLMIFSMTACGKKAQDSHYLGVWKAVSLSAYGDSYDAAEFLEGEFALEFFAEGKGKILSENLVDEDGEKIDDSFQWEEKDEKILVTMLDENLEGWLEDDLLYLDGFMGEDTGLYLSKNGSAKAPKKEEQATKLGFEGLWESVVLIESGSEHDSSDLFPEGIYLELLEGGKGELVYVDFLYGGDSYEESSLSFDWKEAEGGIAIVDEGEELLLTLENDRLVLPDISGEGMVIVFARAPDKKLGEILEAASSFSTSTGGSPWQGKWYGYFWILEAYGEEWEPYEDVYRDVYMFIDVDDEGQGTLRIAFDDDEDTADHELVAYLDISSDDNHIEAKKGTFFDMDLTDLDAWWLALAPNAQGKLLVMLDEYEDPYFEDQGFEYTMAFRPYGELWDEEIENRDHYPIGYKDYLLALEANRPKPGEGRGNAGLPEAKFSGATESFSLDGIKVEYPAGFEAEEAMIVGIEVRRGSTWINTYFDEGYVPVTKTIEDVIEELDYKLSEESAQLYKSTYNSHPCVVLMLDSEFFGPELEIHVPLEGKVLTIKASTSDHDSLGELLSDQDVMAIMSSVTW